MATTANTLTVERVCIEPAAASSDGRALLQPIARVFHGGEDRALTTFCSGLHECVLTPYCSSRHGGLSAYDFCAALPRNGSKGAVTLRGQAAHAFSAVHEVPRESHFPPAGMQHLRRAAIVGYTGNIGHDVYLNGGILDIFAAQQALGGIGALDLILLNIDREGFAELIPRRHESWQLSVLDALFNSSRVRTGLQPLRLTQGLCVDELVWKPPILDFNPISSTNDYVRDARRRVLRRHNLTRTYAARRGWPARPHGVTLHAEQSVVLYTRADAGRRALVLGESGRSGLKPEWERTLGVTRVLRKMPRSPRDQFALWSNADVIIAPHGAARANAFLMHPGAAYVEISPLCIETCLNGCYPYSEAGPKCAANSLVKGAAYRHLGMRHACTEAMSNHGGFGGPMASALRTVYRTVFACEGGSRCVDGRIGTSHAKAAWKYNYHESVRLTDALVEQIRRELAPSAGTAAHAVRAPRPCPSGERARSLDASRPYSWVASAEHGFCGVTEDAGDCSKTSMGSYGMDEMETTTWAHAAFVCRRLLLSCANAKFMSVSLVHKDCSWYSTCRVAASAAAAAERGLTVADFRSGPIERGDGHDGQWGGFNYTRCDERGCPAYTPRSCMCSSGALHSDSALQDCRPSPLCASGKSVTSTGGVRARAARAYDGVDEVEKSGRGGGLALRSQLFRSSKPSAILLFLVFDPRLVRPVYRNRELDAYLREYNRAEQLLRSLVTVRTQLPVYVVVGGDRSRPHEQKLKRLGAFILPVEPLPAPSWASDHYRNNFHKLLSLNMTRFRTVVVLDNDCVATRNIDHLALVPTPAAACQPRRNFQLCSFNFGVHVLSPSTKEAERLLRTYAVRGAQNNGGEQEVWANFHRRIYELPIGFNAHHGLSMTDAQWSRVSVVHAISGHSVNRLPSFLRHSVQVFSAD
jgi:hypothetical protein